MKQKEEENSTDSNIFASDDLQIGRILFDKNLKILAYNLYSQKYIFGKNLPLKERSLQEVLNFKDLQLFAKKIKRNDIEETLIESVSIIRKRKKEYYKFQINSFKYVGKNCFHGLLINITEEMEKIEFLEKSEKKFRTTLHSIGDAVIVTNEKGKIDLLNPVAEFLTGWSAEEAKDKNLSQIFQIYNSSNGKKCSNPITKVIKEGKVVGLANHTTLISKNQHKYHIADSAAPIFDEEKNIKGAVLVFRDVSEDYVLKEWLKKSEKKYRHLVSEMLLGLAVHEIVLDSKGNPKDYIFIDANDSYERITGLKRSDIIGKRVTEILPNVEKYWIDNYGQVALKGKTLHYENYNSDLNKHFEVVAYQPEYGQFAVIVRDITERIQNQEALRKERNLLNNIIQSAPFCVYVKDKDCRFVLANKVGLSKVDMKMEDKIGKTDLELFPRELAEGFIKDDLSVIVDGKVIYGREEFVYEKDGSKIYLNTYKAPWRDEDGNVYGLVGFGIDVTDKMKLYNELYEAKERAEAANRVKSEFLAQMSHEIRSPLNAVLSYSSLLHDLFNEVKDENISIIFNGINSAGKRIIRTIDAILNMSELQTGTYEKSLKSINLNELISSLVHEYQNIARMKNLELDYVIGNKEAFIHNDEYALSQIIVNLIDNAIKYTKQGFIKVRVSKTRAEVFEIEVIDTGIGIAEEFMDQLFEPFSQEEQGYTRMFEGNGLGLALVKRYCEIINGKIRVKSKKGKGTSFILEVGNLE